MKKIQILSNLHQTKYW